MPMAKPMNTKTGRVCRTESNHHPSPTPPTTRPTAVEPIPIRLTMLGRPLGCLADMTGRLSLSRDARGEMTTSQGQLLVVAAPSELCVGCDR